MRVLLLTQVLPYPPDSGPKVRAWTLLKCIGTQHEVTLVSFVRGDQSGDARRLEPYCRVVHTVPIHRGTWSDLWALARSLVMRQPFLMVRDDQPAMRQLVKRVTAQTHFDIAHADQLNMAQYAADVSGARKILDAHNALALLCRQLSDTMPSGARRALLRRDARLLRRYEARVATAFDAVLTVTEEDRLIFEQATGSCAHLTVVPIAVDTAEVLPVPRDPDATRITHLGTMYWPPNVDAVLWFTRQVYPRLRAQYPTLGLDIIGARPPREIRALTGNDPSIRVTGYVEDPTPYLRRSAVMVVPLRVGSGMRVKILNGLAQELPMVSTTVGCSGIAVEAGRHLLIADTPEDFAAATLRVLKDRSLADALGRNGRRLVQTHYDQHVIGPRILDVYRQLGGVP